MKLPYKQSFIKCFAVIHIYSLFYEKVTQYNFLKI